MKRAKNFEDLIIRIAEELQMVDLVYCNVDTLQYSGISNEWLSDYDEYLEMTDEEFAKASNDKLRDWQHDLVTNLRQARDSKSCITKPESFEAFRWMEEFTENHTDNPKFFNAAVKALRNRHPFRGFRSAVDLSNLTDEWYIYRDSRMEGYVRNKLSRFLLETL